jgi:hypothetical protein
MLILILAAGLFLLGLVLTLHQVGMDHNDDMGLAGACLAVLAAALMLLLPRANGQTLWSLPSASPVRAVQVVRGRPRCRPPPPVEGTVLLC